MMSIEGKYMPEMGQAIFGQPHKEYAVPQIWDAALCFLREELDRVQWNAHQKEYSSPFNNTGNTFKCAVFEVHAYSWDDEYQPYNFKWRDVEISWYKYLGRGMSASRPLPPDLAAAMLQDCMEACQQYRADQDAGDD